MSDRLKAIFFDVGSTLLFPSQERIFGPLRERKVVPSLEQLQALERRTKNEYDAILQRDGRADRGFWHLFYSHLLEELGIEDDTTSVLGIFYSFCSSSSSDSTRGRSLSRYAPATSKSMACIPARVAPR